jgi:hypothetical protein
VLGWVQATEVAFTKTYTLVNTRTCPGAGPELLHACLLGTLSLVKELAGKQAGELAETLAGAARVLMSKLQELASSSLSLGLPGDPLSQVCSCLAEFKYCYCCYFAAESLTVAALAYLACSGDRKKLMNEDVMHAVHSHVSKSVCS